MVFKMVLTSSGNYSTLLFIECNRTQFPKDSKDDTDTHESYENGNLDAINTCFTLEKHAIQF